MFYPLKDRVLQPKTYIFRKSTIENRVRKPSRRQENRQQKTFLAQKIEKSVVRFRNKTNRKNRKVWSFLCASLRRVQVHVGKMLKF